jgi:hypothetical protein
MKSNQTYGLVAADHFVLICLSFTLCLRCNTEIWFINYGDQLCHLHLKYVRAVFQNLWPVGDWVSQEIMLMAVLIRIALQQDLILESEFGFLRYSLF